MPRRLLLVGWEAADWATLHPLLDAGEMPALCQLVENGASGALLSLQPAVSAMQWTTLATGKRAWQHGVCHSVEIAHEGVNVTVPIGARRRRSATLWDIIAHEHLRPLVVGWPATHGVQNGRAKIVSDRYSEPTAPPGVKPWPPASPGTYSPEEIAAALDELRVSPEEIAADIIGRYIPLWRKIDQKRDRRIGQLRVLLAADFCYQTALSELMTKHEWDFATVRFPALGGISQIFMPYHPLRHLSASEEDEFQFYREVVSSHYRMLDLMLRRLITVAGPEAAVLVVSNHETLPQGIFAAGGPGFSRDALLHGASILDVAPTILTWFGLPIGDDMEGRVLTESFPGTPEIERVPSWDARLGVLNQTCQKNEESIESNSPQALWQVESEWNYAQSCMEGGRYENALPVLEKLFRAFPERAENGHALFQCQLALGHLSEAESTLEVVLEALAPGLITLLLRAELALARRDMRLARSLVSQARQLDCQHPPTLRRMGLLLLRLRDWDALAALANRALLLDENDALAWLGLAEAHFRKGEAPKAADAARRAIGIKYFLPEAHFVLARALVAQGHWTEAHDAMQALLKLQPNHRTASTYLKRMPPPATQPGQQIKSG